MDIPDYFLNTSTQALAILEQLSAPNVQLQYDLYHMHRMGDDMPVVIADNINRIGHFQVAGYPGRHEPDVGDVPYKAAFTTIDALGYEGWIGCEYAPAAKTEAGLGWARHWL